jgi:hypothetical protein
LTSSGKRKAAELLSKKNSMKRGLGASTKNAGQARIMKKNANKRAKTKTADDTNDDDDHIINTSSTSGGSDDAESMVDEYDIDNISDDNNINTSFITTKQSATNKVITPAKVYDDEDAIQNLSDADEYEEMNPYLKNGGRRYVSGGVSGGEEDDDEYENGDEDAKEQSPASDANSNETESINHIDDENDEEEEEEDEDEEVDDDPKSDCNNNKTLKSKAKNYGRGAKKEENTSSKKTSKVTRSKNTETNNSTSGSVVKPTGNPDEPLYCVCREISYGQMICCDNDGCRIEWFHFNCVKLVMKPKGKWYCPECRGDSHRVMKKTHLINQGANSSASASPSSYYSKQK